MLDLTGKRLKIARIKSGMRQADAARAMGFPRQTLISIEEGKRYVYAFELPKFAKLYHVPVEELLYSQAEINELLNNPGTDNESFYTQTPTLECTELKQQSKDPSRDPLPDKKNSEMKDRIKEEILKIIRKYPADDITVKLFCAESGISRQTLYNYYDGIMDAVEDVCKSDLTKILNGSLTNENWVEGVKRLLQFVKENRDICLHFYFSSHREDFLGIIEDFGTPLVENAIIEAAEDLKIGISPKDEKFMLRFYTTVFMGISKDYFEGRMMENPEYIASRCDVMMRSSIRNSLNNLENLKKGTF